MNKQEAVDTLKANYPDACFEQLREAVAIAIIALEQPEVEKLTDGEQRLFLAAMGRELKICKQIDKEYGHKNGLVSLVHMCYEIERKVHIELF